MTTNASASSAVETRTIALVALVQVVNILDFIMVMPMGPEFAKALGIPLSHLGYVGGTYTAAACVSGLISSTFLERFDRRSALIVALLGLTLGTISGAFATGFPSLLLARAAAGAFGGPATALSYAIVADIVPPERRGRATGLLMGAFAVASVLGVPAGLSLAQNFGWRAPFIAVGLLGALIAAAAFMWMPTIRGHLDRQGPEHPALRDVLRPDIVWALLLTFTAMSATFSVIPHIAGYLQFNLGFPRKNLGTLYLVGGLVSLVTSQLAGRLVDKIGSRWVGGLGTLLICATTYVGFGLARPLVQPLVFFVFFLFAAALRNVSFRSLSTKVPLGHERARFQSIDNAVSHFAAATGAFLSSRLLSERADGSLAGMPDVAHISMVFSIVFLPLIVVLEMRLKRRAAFSAAAGAVGGTVIADAAKSV